ncbi:MAG: nicotinate-nucleotide--dimethylbenzimidazole phosphoribosyltransferase [Gammaproteobacteria bacterium]|nr:nicotinate-nucleotide--dimethylbenzimidazole phosphoribosyltransferase [Gammaproteobacteria bacterium]
MNDAAYSREILAAVPSVSTDLAAALQHKIDTKTKPLGALGTLEDLAKQLGLIQNRVDPVCTVPTIVVFAADHGIAAEGVSAFPTEVTAQMVANFLAGGAAINVFARANGMGLKIVDAGVASEIPGAAKPLDRKIRLGTANAATEPAMSDAELDAALSRGAQIVDELHDNGTNVVGFGEMGIGNTSAAALILSLLSNTPINRCAGRGTGLDDTAFARKLAVLERVVKRVEKDGGLSTPWDALRQCGGFEIAMMTGAMLRAAQHQMCVIVDGFIATSAALIGARVSEHFLPYCVFAHRSDEAGHGVALDALGASPLLALNMRLGEGTGAALAYPLIAAAAAFLNEMASFESAGVSDR